MAYSDSVGAGAVALLPMSLTDSKIQLLTNMIENINREKANNTDLTDTAKVLLDDLDSRISTLTNADTISDAEIQSTLDAIIDLQSDSTVSDTFIGVLGTIFTVLNTSKTIESYDVLINTATGVQSIDISAYNFADANDYQIQLTMKGMSPVTFGYQNKTNTAFEIVVADDTEWEFNSDTIRYKDCSATDDNLTITVAIIALPVTQLSATFTLADGTTKTIGA